MNCPFCQYHDTRVIDSRLLPEMNSVKRRRKCESCQKRFTTYECVNLDMPQVVKNDGRRENFDRNKIISGIQKACQKRPISVGGIDKMVTQIEKEILETDQSEVTTKQIGWIVIQHLRKLDPVAYVRFASVYKSFDDIHEFINDLTLGNFSEVSGKEEGPHARS